MRRRRPKNTRVSFPFPPPKPSKLPAKQEVLTPEIVGKATDPIIDDPRESVKRITEESKDGNFSYQSSVVRVDYRDERVFRVERTTTGWRTVATWRSEGSGPLPLLVSGMMKVPDLLDAIMDLMSNIRGHRLFGAPPERPDDELPRLPY